MSVSAVTKDEGSTFAQYTLLLVSADDTAESSILIPKCYTIKDMGLNKDKKDPTKLDLQFVAINKNRFKKLFYMRPVDDLVTLLGIRSPL